jgi:hypothetical protein
MPVSCRTNIFFSNFRASFFSFFQLSTQKFLGFFYFRAKKNVPEKLSRQKNPGVPTFEPEIFTRKNFQTVRAGTDRSENLRQPAPSPS